MQCLLKTSDHRWRSPIQLIDGTLAINLPRMAAAFELKTRDPQPLCMALDLVKDKGALEGVLGWRRFSSVVLVLHITLNDDHLTLDAL